MKIKDIVNFVIILVSVALSAGYLYFFDGFSFLTVLVAAALLFISSVFQNAVHESGHYAGGRISGYKLVMIRIGYGMLYRDKSGKLRLSVKKSSGGQCIMQPSRSDPVKYKAYNAGGVFFNAVFSAAAFALLFINSYAARLAFIDLLYFGVCKIVINSIPRTIDSVPSDGYTLKLLKNDPATQADYFHYLNLYAALFRDEKIDPAEYTYEREPEPDKAKLIYYDEIRAILEDIKSEEPAEQNRGKDSLTNG